MKIVVTDDDMDLLEVTAALLREEGYDVATASSGTEALETVLQDPPDLVISDVEMPGMTGLQLAQKMSEDPLLRNIPVILFSGRRISSQDRIQGLSAGGDNYLLKPFTPDELIAQVKALLRRTQIGLDANPLTHLPGNSSILREIEARVARKNLFAVLYADLNHFKAFNDRYGFLRGDDVLRFTAHVLLNAAAEETDMPFVGHVGGDDFVMIAAPDRAEPLCRNIIQAFDAGIQRFYNPEDLSRKKLEVLDRQGKKTTYPIMGIAIGVATNARREIRSVGEVSQVGAELKKFAKSFPGSRYVIDQRENSSAAPGPSAAASK
jgi:diguanylate cyclase (GGDEF)-like protein